MAYIGTGYKRSLIITLTKKVDGQLLYTRQYNGQNTFEIDGVTYPTLTDFQFQTMTEANYLIRLAAFKSYVESIEKGLVFDNVIVAGHDSMIYDLGACPTPTDISAIINTASFVDGVASAMDPITHYGGAAINNGSSVFGSISYTHVQTQNFEVYPSYGITFLNIYHSSGAPEFIYPIISLQTGHYDSIPAGSHFAISVGGVLPPYDIFVDLKKNGVTIDSRQIYDLSYNLIFILEQDFYDPDILRLEVTPH